MPQCPTCQASYPPSQERCPTDGTLLVISAVGGARSTDEGPASRSQVAAAATIDARGGRPLLAESGPNLPAPDEEMAVGVMVGEYRITGKIGEGGMGTVFAGEHPVIGKRVAVKVLGAAFSNDATIVQRFTQEARAVNQIGHRNIIDIFAFGQLPSGRQYFVMEFLPGRSLKDRLRQPPLPTYAEVFSILSDCCGALAAAHAEGIVHRDLKPENVYLAESKVGDTVVKLLDFGIAKLVRREQEGGMSQTRTGTVMGTPLYMSPEQCTGRGVDARTDVYSVGVVMFEMFTGQLPFPGPSYAETVNGHLSLPPPLPLDLADMPVPLAELILQCLEKEPDKRPAGVLEVRDRLKALSDEHTADFETRPIADQVTGGTGASLPRRGPTSRSPGRSGSRTVSRFRRYRGLMLSTAAVIAAFLAGGWFWMTHPAPPPVVAALPPAPVIVTPPPAPTMELQVVSDPPGAQVTLDGVKQTLRTPSLYRLPLAAHVRIGVEKEGWKAYDQTVAFADGETQKSVLANLESEKPPIGHLRISTPAHKATWTLDGKPVGDGSGTLELDEIAPGDHRVAVSSPGRTSREEAVTVRANETATFEWRLLKDHRAARGPHPPEAADPAAPSLDLDGTSGWPPK